MENFCPGVKQIEMEYVFIILLFAMLRQYSFGAFCRKKNALAKRET